MQPELPRLGEFAQAGSEGEEVLARDGGGEVGEGEGEVVDAGGVEAEDGAGGLLGGGGGEEVG